MRWILSVYPDLRTDAENVKAMTYNEAMEVIEDFIRAAKEPYFTIGFLKSSLAHLISDGDADSAVRVIKSATKDLQPCQKETMPTKEAAEAIW